YICDIRYVHMLEIKSVDVKLPYKYWTDKGALGVPVLHQVHLLTMDMIQQYAPRIAALLVK
ncbi:hypothetical protein, partial [Clostridioides difficile]|uniref:hypothetical protein n=1 Tax=Clostridioides difficile TaxID=1496 RepID=UPI002113EF64